MARVANHEVGFDAKLRADGARGQQRLERGIHTDRAVATASRRNRPPAPVAPDVNERAATAFLERDVGNRILRQPSDERAIEEPAGGANGFLYERVHALGRRGRGPVVERRAQARRLERQGRRPVRLLHVVAEQYRDAFDDRVTVAFAAGERGA